MSNVTHNLFAFVQFFSEQIPVFEMISHGTKAPRPFRDIFTHVFASKRVNRDRSKCIQTAIAFTWIQAKDGVTDMGWRLHGVLLTWYWRLRNIGVRYAHVTHGYAFFSLPGFYQCHSPHIQHQIIGPVSLGWTTTIHRVEVRMCQGHETASLIFIEYEDHHKDQMFFLLEKIALSDRSANATPSSYHLLFSVLGVTPEVTFFFYVIFPAVWRARFGVHTSLQSKYGSLSVEREEGSSVNIA